MKKPLAASITCISLLAATVATGAAAQDGCFGQRFDAAHLAAHPDQVVEHLRLYISGDASRPGTRFVEVTALMARQGHALRRGAGGMLLEEFALCDADGICSIACDGGTFILRTLSPAEIELETADARVSAQPCTPGTVVSTLADIPGEVTVYRLSAQPEAECGR